MRYTKHSNKKKQKERKSTSKKIQNKVGVILFRVVFISILVIIFATVGSGLGAFMGLISSTPDIALENIFPEGFTTIVYDQKDTEVAKLHGTDANRILVELDQIPDYLQKAVIATEDERFYEHMGIDPKGILRAIFVNIKERSLSEGASTLTQQVIKNNVLTADKKFERKIKEQYLAVKLEKDLAEKHGKKKAKDMILESYLNTIPCGHGTNGVQSAAQRYFNKDVWDLTVAESAVLAGITQRPTYYSPVLNPENNREKQVIILDKMLEQNYITIEEYEEALQEDVYSKIQKVNQQFATESHNSYFVDEVIDNVVDDLQTKLGMSVSQAYNLVYRGGLNIYITQDLNMQKVVDDVYLNDELFTPNGKGYELKLEYAISIEHKENGVKHYFKEKIFKNKEDADKFIEEYKNELLKSGDKILKERPVYIPQPQSAMVIMDYNNGHIKAMIGGRGKKEANQTFNRATDAKRQPGSTFKILAAYAPAMDSAGYTPATIIDDVPYTIEIPGQKDYEPKNWYHRNSYKYWYRGLTTVRTAIRDSMNICAVKTVHDIGIPTAFDYLLNFGFTSLVDRTDSNGNHDKVHSLPLGGLTNGVSVQELTAAYGTIANKGVYIEPILYTKVLDHKGNILLDNKPMTSTVLKETTAFQLTDMMKDVVTSGTGTLAKFKNINMPVAGKTGTTTDDKDLIFAGYTPYYAASIWFGHDEPKELKYDYSYHNVVWRTIMEEIHKDLPYKDFEQPNGLVKAKICVESGKLAVDGLCDHDDHDPRSKRVITEYFVKGTEPTEPCDVHVRKTLCTTSGLFANEYCPEDTKEEKLFIVRPEPLPLEDLSEAILKRIEDYEMELPQTMIGEYCNVHGPLPKVINPFQPGENDFSFPDDTFFEDPIDDEVLEPPVEDEQNSLDDFIFNQ